MSNVSIVKCTDYIETDIKQAIDRTFDLLELSSAIRPGMKVLLKPNLLINLKPEIGATTHPMIVKAVADKVRGSGALPFLGDSPGGIGAMYDNVLKETGMKDIGVPIVNFEDKGMRKFDNPGGCVDPLFISNVALSFDLIINLPKLKTHQLTRLTCGIKNMFGCVPGLNKVRHHLEAPDAEDFASSLVDLFEKIRPAVTIVDAVVSMEGHGPTNGEQKRIGFIVSSLDTVSVDAVCSKIMGHDPMEILTTKIADSRDLGEGHLEHIHILGEPLVAIKDFKKADVRRSMFDNIPGFLLPLVMLLKPIFNRLRVRPVINHKKCVRCRMCVNSCPAKAIDPKAFKIDPNKCIMCFCCHELCRYGAIDMKESILWKILKRRSKRM